MEALTTSFESAQPDFYNSLEAPVLEKYPLLAIFQEFLLENGASVALMSGSGSTTFALINGCTNAERLSEKFKGKFGHSAWVEVVEVHQ